MPFQALLAHNAKVYLATRNEEKTKHVIEELEKETGKKGIFLHLDLADLLSVKRAAEEFQRFDLFECIAKHINSPAVP